MSFHVEFKEASSNIYRYFPTDELENVPERPEVAAARANAMATSHPVQVGEETGLPFIGYTYTRLYVSSDQDGARTVLTMILATASVARAGYKGANCANNSHLRALFLISFLHYVCDDISWAFDVQQDT